MKRNFVFSIICAIAIILSFTSCEKCQNCFDGLNSTVVCKDDFGTRQDYKDFIEIREAAGDICKPR